MASTRVVRFIVADHGWLTVIKKNYYTINCYNTILKVGIKKIVYSDVRGNIISCYTKNYNIIHESYGYRYMIKYNIC